MLLDYTPGNMRARYEDGHIVLDYGDYSEIFPSLEDIKDDPNCKNSPGEWVFIYALADPLDGRIRYIGKSIRPTHRLTNHCNEKPTCHRTKWIHSLLKEGRRPVLGVLERISPGGNWQVAERAWISYARENGWPLVNGTDGGDGVSGLSQESKDRMSRTWLGRKHSPESIAKIGAASRGMTHTEEYKQMMREKMSVRVFTPEHRKRLSMANSLSPGIVSEIYRRLSENEKVKDIAKAVGISRATVSRYKKSSPK